jgi:hypothetical protein
MSELVLEKSIPDNWIITNFNELIIFLNDHHSNGNFQKIRENVQSFEGKLIPQYLNDESVEILLNKISQEKQQLIQKQKPSRSTKNVK